ncbi:MAG: hypothetical protein IJ309_05490 [Clostridia bacterium]|nr:hypothetical protein [Clostridia bacterium]
MGSGMSGNYSNTKGANNSAVPIKSMSDLHYNKQKTEGYLLNPNHPVGSAKAKFMKEVLGYTQNDSKLFHENVTKSILGKSPTKTETTQYGVKHTYHTTLVGKNGQSVTAKVVVVIQKDHGQLTYKIITVYPD